MHVLSIGSDREVLRHGSKSAERQKAYGTKWSRLDIIVFTRKKERLAPQTLAEGTHVYPTSSLNRLLYIIDAYRKARTLAKPDVVTAQDPFEAGFAAWLIASHWRVPLHLQVHTDFLSPVFARDSFLNKLRRFIANFVIPRAARVRVVSERIKESIETTYHLQVPISVLPIFVDLARFREASSGALLGKFIRFSEKLLVVARLEREKNVGLALRAFAKSAPQDSCLIVVGEGSEMEFLRREAQKFKIADRVFFEGAQDSAPYYALADLILVPSAYEGYGLVVVEALAAGKPVLSTDIGVSKEVGALIAEPERFADSLCDWFLHGPRTGTLGDYPYRDFDEYVQKLTEDVALSIPQRL